MINSEKLSVGVDNLLINCADLKVGDDLLIIRERESLGWYKNDISEVVATAAIKKGIKTSIIDVGKPDNSEKKSLIKEVNEHSCTIFFARIGDQDRFEEKKYATKRVMSYVRSAESLSSTFGTTNYHSNIALKNSIDSILSEAKRITITCPLGTNISGHIRNNSKEKDNEVSVYRFPLVVAKPINCSLFSGNVVLNNYLTSTGSKVYEPNFLKINKPINFKIDNGYITNVEGIEEDLKSINDHYDFVSKKFNLDRNCVHSWHPGLHPGVHYDKNIEQDPDQWSNTVFASPKFLHFHTCGNYAPGEICWMLKNHSVFVDNLPLWQNGHLTPFNFKNTSECLEKHKEIKSLFVN